MQTVLDIIDKFGGLTKMSQKINVPISTIQSWGRSNKIPHWRKYCVVSAAKSLKIEINDEIFTERNKDEY